MKIYNLTFLLLFQVLSCGQAAEFSLASQLANNPQHTGDVQSGGAVMIFKSDDGGNTWLDISKGFPEMLTDDNVAVRNGFFTDENGLYFSAGDGLYYNKPNSGTTSWKKETLPDEHSRISPGKDGLYAYNNWGPGIYQRLTGTGVWSPVFPTFQEKGVLSVFETSAGTIFIGSHRGLFRSTNSGRSWKQINTGGWDTKLVESGGVLLATSQQGILRSTDDGENWAPVINEGGVGIDVERIKGGFAAITYSTISKTRRIRTSYDGGTTWQAIDAGLQAPGFIDQILPPVGAGSLLRGSFDSTWHPGDTSNLTVPTYITTIIRLGENFFCGHSDGIYRSSDNGKTWKLVLKAEQGKMFKVSVSGNVIYAVQVESHC